MRTAFTVRFAVALFIFIVFFNRYVFGLYFRLIRGKTRKTITAKGRTGTNTVKLKLKLKRGRYRVTVTAASAAPASKTLPLG